MCPPTPPPYLSALFIYPIFTEAIQLSQGYRATTRKQFKESFTIKFPEIPGTHLIDPGRIKGSVEYGATH